MFKIFHNIFTSTESTNVVKNIGNNSNIQIAKNIIINTSPSNVLKRKKEEEEE